MKAQLCRICASPISTGLALCRTHAGDLHAVLIGLPAMLDELDVTITRQGRLTEGQRIQGAEQPLPFVLRAADIRQRLGNAIVFWARAFGAARYGSAPVRAGKPLPCAGYLADIERLIVRDTDAGAVLTDLDRLMTDARAAIDHPPEMIYVGRCECTADLYVRVEESTKTCNCGRQYDVAERRAAMLSMVEDRLATATEIARAVAAYSDASHPLSQERLRQWVRRGLLVNRGRGTHGDNLYRVGDVLDLVRRHAERSRP